MKAKKLEEIEQLRAEMVRIGLIFGINHPAVLKLSQKVDLLHNELLKIELIEKEIKNRRNNNTFKLYENSLASIYA